MSELVRVPSALRARLDRARSHGQRIGLVPTMGALHAGHVSLVRAATARADHVVVTVFVNPLQFAPDDDLERYPRTLDEDVAKCTEAGALTVFAPSRGALYPEGFSTRVEVGRVTAELEGVHRPGHFGGVTTIVAKLFNLTGPCVAVFGRKDYQQLKTIERMARDLNMPVEVVGAPIVREPDGLALSSRNRYLNNDERERALGIVTGLRAAYDAFEAGERSAAELTSLARAPIDGAFDAIDYVSIATPDELRSIEGQIEESAVLAVAAHLGDTRLIDNVVLGVDPRESLS